MHGAPQQVVQVNYQAPPKAGCEDADKCCCCIPIRSGAIILFVFAVLNAIYSAYSIFAAGSTIDNLEGLGGRGFDYGTFKTTLVLSAIIGFIGGLIAVVLFALWLKDESS